MTPSQTQTPNQNPRPLNLVAEAKARAVLKSDWLYHLASPEGKARMLAEHLAKH